MNYIKLNPRFSLIRLSKLTIEDKKIYMQRLRLFLADLVLEYPEHMLWFDSVAEIIFSNGNRDAIIIVYGDEIVAAAIIKDTEKEKKICTLRVKKQFQHQGLGSFLVNECMSCLQTKKPIISVSGSKLKEFSCLFRNNGFTLEQVCPDKYRYGCTEYIFNGKLSVEEILIPEKKKAEIA